MNLSKSLRISMAKKGVNAVRIGEALSVSRQQVSKWVRTGKMNTEVLSKLCDYFDISVSEFIKLGEDE